MSESRDRESNSSLENRSARFLTTQWTEVLAARGTSDAALTSLRTLCDRYYAPVFAFVASYTNQSQDARDMTHAFFAKLLEGGSLDTLQTQCGRFRSFLLGAVKHFLADLRSREHAAKRGGKAQHQSIEELEHHSSMDGMPAEKSQMPPDAYFDRQWAISIIDHSLRELESEARSQGLEDRFVVLRPWLSGESEEKTQREASRQLGVSEEVVKVTLHRWRKRFRSIVKMHIAATVLDPEEVDRELGYLIQALAYRGDLDDSPKSE